MKAYGGVDVEIHIFLSSALSGEERLMYRRDNIAEKYMAHLMVTCISKTKHLKIHAV
jgi:hypothetical protein